MSTRAVRRRSSLWTPALLGTAIAAWYDASDGSTLFTDTTESTPTPYGGSVGRMKDKSGNGKHADTSTLSAKPTRSATAINGLPGITVDGTDLLVTPAIDLSATTDGELWVVGRTSSPAASQVLTEFGQADVDVGGLSIIASGSAWIAASYAGGGTSSQHGGQATDSSAHALRATYSSLKTTREALICVDGATITGAMSPDANRTGTMANVPLTIGARLTGLYPTTGAFGEIILLKRLLTAAEAQLMGEYLARKWSTAAPWTPYTILSALAVWLDAQDTDRMFTDATEATPTPNAGSVGRLKDKSLNYRHGDQSTAASKPTRSDTGLPTRTAMTFDGGDRLIVPASALSGLTRFEVWVVGIFNAVTDKVIVENYAGSNNSILIIYRSGTTIYCNLNDSAGTLRAQKTLTVEAAGPHVLRAIVDTTQTTASNLAVIFSYDNVTANAAAPGAAATIPMAANAVNIGGRYDNSTYLTGAIAELLVFNRPLTALESVANSGYLRTRWVTP